MMTPHWCRGSRSFGGEGRTSTLQALLPATRQPARPGAGTPHTTPEDISGRGSEVGPTIRGAAGVYGRRPELVADEAQFETLANVEVDAASHLGSRALPALLNSHCSGSNSTWVPVLSPLAATNSWRARGMGTSSVFVPNSTEGTPAPAVHSACSIGSGQRAAFSCNARISASTSPFCSTGANCDR